MRLIINHKKIIESPFEEKHTDSFVFDENLLTQVSSELIKGTPACYLISGYRGVGKSSFLNKIKSSNTEETAQFIHLNLAKYTNHSFVLRKIIREIFLQLNQTDSWENLSKETKNKISGLYQNTFNKINDKKLKEISKENKTIVNTNFNFKDLTLLIIAILAGINLKTNFITFPKIPLNELIIISTIITEILTHINFSHIYSKTKKSSEQRIIESLYDDEIAEFRLIDLLKSTTKENLKLVFIIDELDKLNRKYIEELISELKPLILSGKASFVFVSGQSLYYKVKQSITKDDSIMSSLFSKIIHIPLMSSASFEKIFSIIIKDSTNKEYKYVLDSLILQSHRIPRKFINIIRDKITWDKSTAVIDIEESLLEAYKTDSTILTIIDKIIEQGDISEDDLSTKDFFVNQIFLWSNIIKTKKTGYFSADEICNLDHYSEEYYFREDLSQLNELCLLLLETMSEESLLERKTKKKETEVITYYKWKSDVKINSENIKSDSNVIKSKFLEEFIDLEKYVRDIYVDVFEGYRYDSPKKSLKQMIMDLSKQKVIQKKWVNTKRFNDLIDLRNKIVHAHPIKVQDLDLAQEFKFLFNRFKAELIEDYTYYVTNNYFSEKQFRLNRGIKINRDLGVDFVATHPKIDLEILFEVKYGNYNSINRIFDQINKIAYYLTKNKNSIFVMFVYSKNNRKNYDSLIERTDDIIYNKFPELKQRIKIFYTSEYRGDPSTGRLRLYLDKIMNYFNERF